MSEKVAKFKFENKMLKTSILCVDIVYKQHNKKPLLYCLK